MSFTVARSSIGDQPIVTLQEDAGRRVRVACHGGALVSFEVPREGRPIDIAAGHRDAAEISTHPGSRFALLAPFAGRIADARYRFDGRQYDLQPKAGAGRRDARHGFVRDADFAVAELVADAVCARARMTARIDEPTGYPFVIDLSVSFTLDAAGLTLEARMRNAGDRAAPCFFGWHPYFRLSDGVADEWLLEVPARTLIRTGSEMIPLAGAAAYAPLTEAAALDFSRARLIGDSVLDHGYADLVADPDGRIRTRLRDPKTRTALTVWQEHGVMHVFTGDTLKRDARRSVALEPMECMADAFNRPEWAQALRLEPGAERVYRCGVETTG